MQYVALAATSFLAALAATAASRQAPAPSATATTAADTTARRPMAVARGSPGSVPVMVLRVMIGTDIEASPQIAHIGGDRFDLRVGQAVRDRLHDRRVVRIVGILPAFLAPVLQLGEDVVVELARQARKVVLAPGVRAVTHGAGRHVRRDAGFEQPLSLRRGIARRPAERLGI